MQPRFATQRERGRVVDDREDRRVPARERHRHLVDVVRVLRRARASGGRSRRRRRSGTASCGTAAAAGAAGRSRRRRGSSATRSPFVSPRVGEEDLVRVRDRDVVAADAHRGRLARDAEGRSSPSSSRSRRSAARRYGRATAARASDRRRPPRARSRPEDGQRRACSRSAPTTRPTRRGSAAARRRARSGRSTTRRPARASSRRSPTRSRSSSASRTSEVSGRTCRSTASFAPGTKPFDFDINQISFTPARAKVVTFSTSYYDVNQAIVVLKGTQIAKRAHGRRPAGLQARRAARHDELRRSSRTRSSRRSSRPSSRRTPAPIQALKNKQIDGLVVDLPTAFYVTAVQVPNSTILGQFPAGAGGEHFGMVFAKGNPLAALRRPARSRSCGRTAR